MLSTHPRVKNVWIYTSMLHMFTGGYAELSAGTPLISLYDLCSDTVNISDTVALTCGLLVNDAVERSGKMWASHTFRYCPRIWLEGQRENVMNVETDGLQSQI
jgi:hypothetical protein